LTLHFWLLIALIQVINILLMIPGFFVTAADLWLGTPEPWLWDNSDDKPLLQGWSKLYTLYWMTFRNPVANFRFVPGVSKKGRPLFYRDWFWTWNRFGFKKQFYVKIGWMSNGYPCSSWGAGRGY
jgi:hypothetical protein